jgi:hypothetical protein
MPLIEPMGSMSAIIRIFSRHFLQEGSPLRLEFSIMRFTPLTGGSANGLSATDAWTERSQ